MADSNYVADGQVYDDEASAVVANHPNIPDELKRLYVSPKPPPEGSTEAAGALKSSEGTKPTPQDVDAVRAPMGVMSDLEAPQGSLTGQVFAQKFKDFLGTLWNSAKLPGDVAAGDVDPTSPEGIQKANDLAHAMVFYPAPIASKVADGSLGSFAGVRSVLGNPEARQNLYNAVRADLEGATPDEIYSETGWFKGRDNKWKLEIPDTNSKLNVDNLTQIPAKSDPNGWTFIQGDDKVGVPEWDYQQFGAPKLGEILDHPELFKAYPELKDMEVQRLPSYARNLYNGMYDPNTKKIYMNDLTPEQFHSTLLHETQHAIQDMEGFATGGNSTMFTPQGLDAATKQWRDAENGLLQDAKKSGVTPGEFGVMQGQVGMELKGWPQDYIKQDVIKKAKDLGLYERIRNIEKGRLLLRNQSERQDEYYRRLMGEVEARNVQRRMNMSPAELNTTHPFATEDRPSFVQLNSSNNTPSGSEVIPFRRAANDNVSPEEFVKKFLSDLPEYTKTERDDILTRLKEALDEQNKE